ncbi:MAG: hypothetical protein HS113_02575 [Verrucomicrobiales bacterium]|nr:hypothetical protein [Verrucomicrobiales bacterium]
MNTCTGTTTTATANCFGPVGGTATGPSIMSVTVADGIATISWAATPGTVYVLQGKSDLHGGNWINLAGEVTANGTTASQSDAVDARGQCFYRVMVVR